MKTLTVVAALSAACFGTTATAQDFWLGQIIQGGWNFCPRTTISAEGQLLPIAQYNALFSLFGTNYGGDGRTTFGLPDLRGRSAIGQGQGPGLPSYRLGVKAGQPSVQLGLANLPAHSHTARGTPNGVPTPANNPSPAGNVPALTAAANSYAPVAGTTVPMAADSVSVTVDSAGSGQAFSIENPYQVVMYCIVAEGIYPSRN